MGQRCCYLLLLDKRNRSARKQSNFLLTLGFLAAFGDLVFSLSAPIFGVVNIVFQRLLNLKVLQLESWHLDQAASCLTLSGTSTQTVGRCPVCFQPSQRIHSRYQRKVADLPLAAFSLLLHLGVRKFFCVNDRLPFTNTRPTARYSSIWKPGDRLPYWRTVRRRHWRGG